MRNTLSTPLLRMPPQIAFPYFICAHYISLHIAPGRGWKHWREISKRWVQDWTSLQSDQIDLKTVDGDVKWFLSRSSPMKMMQSLGLLIESQDAIAGQNLCHHVSNPSFYRREIKSQGGVSLRIEYGSFNSVCLNVFLFIGTWYSKSWGTEKSSNVGKALV